MTKKETLWFVVTLITLLVVGKNYAQTVPTASEWWKEGTGIATDDSKVASHTGNNSLHVLDDTTAVILFGTGMVFNGTSSELRSADIDALLPGTASLTWGIKYKYENDTGALISYKRTLTTSVYAGWGARNITGNILSTYVSDGTNHVQTTINPAGFVTGDSINVLIVSVDRINNLLYIYVNGVLKNVGGADISSLAGNAFNPPPTYRKVAIGINNGGGDFLVGTVYSYFIDLGKAYNQDAVTNATNCLNGNCIDEEVSSTMRMMKTMKKNKL